MIMMDYKNTCPLCGDTLIYDGGYIQCQDPACGWNKPIDLNISRYNPDKDVIRGTVDGDYSLIHTGKAPEITFIRNYKLCLASNSLKIALKYNKVS